jgi:hypothetical protein
MEMAKDLPLECLVRARPGGKFRRGQLSFGFNQKSAWNKSQLVSKHQVRAQKKSQHQMKQSPQAPDFRSAGPQLFN